MVIWPIRIYCRRNIPFVLKSSLEEMICSTVAAPKILEFWNSFELVNLKLSLLMMEYAEILS